MSLSAPLVFSIALAAFVVLHIIGWKLAEKLGKRLRLATGILAALFCLPGAWFTLYYLHRLPEPPLLYELRALPISEGFLSVFGVARYGKPNGRPLCCSS